MQLKFMEGTTSNTKRPGEPVLSSFVFLDTTPLNIGRILKTALFGFSDQTPRKVTFLGSSLV